jgi:hypothetical protein
VKLSTTISAIATTLGVALSVPPLRMIIEQNMAWHMVFQMPLLVVGGWFIFFSRVSERLGNSKSVTWLDAVASLNQFGLTGFLLVTVVFSYWMLPLALDKAIVQPAADLIKITTLILSGVVLRESFRCAPVVVQLFFMAYWSSMLVWLGAYFTTTDLRLCNVYSLETQYTAGKGLIALGIGVGTLLIAKIVASKRKLG